MSLTVLSKSSRKRRKGVLDVFYEGAHVGTLREYFRVSKC
jgi:hypothetical protein